MKMQKFRRKSQSLSLPILPFFPPTLFIFSTPFMFTLTIRIRTFFFSSSWFPSLSGSVSLNLLTRVFKKRCISRYGQLIWQLDISKDIFSKAPCLRPFLPRNDSDDGSDSKFHRYRDAILIRSIYFPFVTPKIDLYPCNSLNIRIKKSAPFVLLLGGTQITQIS